MTQQPQDAIEAALEPIAKEFWARHSDVPCWILPDQVELFTKISAYILRFGAQRGYESAKASNDLALQLAYESGKEAAEGNGWVKVSERLPDYAALPADKKDDPRLLIATAKGKVFEAYYGQTFYSVRDESEVYKNVVAWMKLPTYESTGE